MKLRLLPSAKKKMEEQQKKQETSSSSKKKNSLANVSDEYKEEIPSKRMGLGDNDTKLVFSVQRQGEFGLPHLDVRKFINTPKYNGPTKAGINIPLDYLTEFLEILTHIKSECEEKKLCTDYNDVK